MEQLQLFPSPTAWAVPDIASQIVGDFFIAKHRRRAAEVGTQAAAVQLRKQGVPLDVALLILLGVV